MTLVHVGLGILFISVIGVMSTISPDLADVLFAVSLALFGAGIGLVFSQLGNVIMSSVPEARTSEAGCATDNFALAQMPPSDYPITVQPGQSQTLRELGFSNQQMPRLKMVDSGENQDACKGARLTLTYAGKGTR